jgi:subtilisin family serine protease
VTFRPLLIALVFALAVPAAASADSSTQIIVKRDAGLTAAERADVRADAQVRFVESLPLPRTEVVAAEPGDVADAIRDLNADPDVVYAERDHVVRALSDDDFFFYQWGLENLGDFTLDDEPAVHDADMDVPDAWDLGATGEGRVVAVVDTGVDASHDDFGGRVLPGWDFVDDDPYASDPHGHGTHVAGTIAAARDNDIGVAGVAPDARILPLRVLGPDGSGLVSDIVKAYEYAHDHGVRVVNASLGSTSPSPTEETAIETYDEITFVVAAGNGGNDGIGDDNDDPDEAEYPCAYDSTNIVCVGASRHDDAPAEFSNFGETTVDVFAPGYGIMSTVPGDDYGWSDGTSMATPHVAGEAALLLARNPELEPDDIKAAVIGSADYENALNHLSVSNGRANAWAALTTIDYDTDGISDGLDNCPTVANPLQDAVCPPAADADGDGLNPPADKCPEEAASYAADGCPSADPTADGDFWPDALDGCLGQAGTVRGCPDGDADGVADWDDNCPAAKNGSQTDSDGDGAGNACDDDRDGDGIANGADGCPDKKGTGSDGCVPGPAVITQLPPEDADGDGVTDASDGCPHKAAATEDGCPLAEVASLSAKPAGRSTTVKVATTGKAMVTVIVERKKGKRWVRVARKTLATSKNKARMRLSHLARGTHRVRIAITSGAGKGRSVTKTFRVR